MSKESEFVWQVSFGLIILYMHILVFCVCFRTCTCIFIKIFFLVCYSKKGCYTNLSFDVDFVPAISPTTVTGLPCLEAMATECSTGLYS